MKICMYVYMFLCMSGQIVIACTGQAVSNCSTINNENDCNNSYLFNKCVEKTQGSCHFQCTWNGVYCDDGGSSC